MENCYFVTKTLLSVDQNTKNSIFHLIRVSFTLGITLHADIAGAIGESCAWPQQSISPHRARPGKLYVAPRLVISRGLWLIPPGRPPKMAETFTLLSHRTLPAHHHLHRSSCCPSMDLVALTTSLASNPSAGDTDNQPSNNDTIVCFRLSGATPQVWSVQVNKFFAENCACVDLMGQNVEIDLGSQFDEITALHWSPDGQSLAAGLSSRSPSRPPTFILLSVHSGQLLAFPTVLTSSYHKDDKAALTSSDDKLGFISWLPLNPTASETSAPDESELTKSPGPIGQSLCDRLPANLTIASMRNIETVRNHMGPVYTSSPSKVATKWSDHYPMVPFPPSLITNRHQSKSSPNVSSLLIISSHSHELHLFANGTVYLGTTKLPLNVRLASVHLMPQSEQDSAALPAAHRGSVCLHFTWFDTYGLLQYGTLELTPSLRPLAFSVHKSPAHRDFYITQPQLSILGIQSKELSQQIQLSHLIQGLLKDSFFAYFTMVKDWHVARMSARKWYESFDELSKAQNVVLPISLQMLQLLFVGFANEGLRDFLGTKNAEKIFAKWETTVSASLTRIRLAIIELLVPVVERLYILVTELRTHGYPDFGFVKLIEDDDFETLLLTESLLKHVLRTVHQINQIAKEEGELFGQFCKWLRAEFEYIAAMENSPSPPVRPPPKYDLMLVSKFIKRGETNPLDAFIFSRFSPKPEDSRFLEDEKKQLAQSHYDELFDVNGFQKRQDIKNKLKVLLSFAASDLPKDPPIGSQPSPSLVVPADSNFVTPDTSHFHVDPNAELKTPTLGDHFKRQSEAVVTPSNVPFFKPPLATASGSDSRYNLNSRVNQTEPEDNESFGVHQPLGIYFSLTYASMYLTKIFTKMFSRIGAAQPVQSLHLPTDPQHIALKSANSEYCSRFVGEFYYCVFMTASDQGLEQIIVNRIKLIQSHKVSSISQKSQVKIDARKDDQVVKILDLDFFDDIELVILGQIGNGFDKKYAMMTLKVVELTESGNPAHYDHLPISRLHYLQSDYAPERISFNGLKGRRTGCVTSGRGRMLHVFDMEDAGLDDSESEVPMAD
ncbi:hypothetical protein O181_003336 [Austropuccinia psidii MF-1]|uniref:Anaphase-promoting complex subunit 4 n=1 Tax=Austropuccinia psidii MF-1 TaxID=1389203 RepID=A0A9Q3BDM2_9BASI|nr:hypothetical protein [Austropuccinia psidii MF-1]